MIAIDSLPVIDVHCHPFADTGALTPAQFIERLSFPGGSTLFMVEGGVADGDSLAGELRSLREHTVFLRYALRLLAQVLDCEENPAAVVAARNQAVQTDYRGYLRQLFAAGHISALVADMGYPQPALDLERFRQDVPIPVFPVYRIEPLIAELLAADVGWEEFRRRFDETLGQALEQGGYRGLKSIIAYRTGLDISPLSRTPDQGQQALEAIRRGTGGQATKKLRDHLLCRALELCREYDVPMQIHTGIGDYEVNMAFCRPALLLDLLRFPAFRACRVILVHAGYPYHAEAGYMAGVLPRVYCDISQGVPFAACAAQRILRQLLEMAPYSKVLYGSDSYSLPEGNYLGAALARTALRQVLSDLVQEGLLSAAEAHEAARLILSENARGLYRLEERPA